MNTQFPLTRTRSNNHSTPSQGNRGLLRLWGFLAQAVIVSMLLLHAAACDDQEEVFITDEVDSSDTRTKDIVELAREVDSLNRFVAALDQAGLVQTVEGYGPWTVFAPIDRAFGRAAARLDTIRRAGLVDSLRYIMQYHVVRGRIDTSEVSQSRGDSLQVATVYNEPVTLNLRPGGAITVGNDQLKGRILDKLEAQNGIIYIVNEVLTLPPPDTTVQSEILFF